MARKKPAVLLFGLIIVGLTTPGLAVSQENKEKTLTQQHSGIPVLWKEPTDISTRDLVLGAGGEAMKPDIRKITFVEEKKGGCSTNTECVTHPEMSGLPRLARRPNQIPQRTDSYGPLVTKPK